MRVYVASLRPGQLVLEDSMWTAVACNSLVYSPLFLAIIVGKEVDTHADFPGCLQDPNSLAMLNVLEIHIIHSQDLVPFLKSCSMCIRVRDHLLGRREYVIKVGEFQRL